MNKYINNKNYVLYFLIVIGIVLLLKLTNIFDNTVKNVVGFVVWIIFQYLFPIVLLFVPFVVGMLSKKRIIIVGWSIMALIVYFLISFTIRYVVYDYVTNFTPQKWASYKYERHFMIDDLNNKYKLTGMSLNNIKILLGEPDFHSENEVEYVIDDGWIDPEMFVLVFKNEKVVEQYTYTEFKP